MPLPAARLNALALAALLALPACQAAPAPAPQVAVPVAAVAPARTASLQVRPSIRDGALRRLMEALAPYTLASIHHMEVKLYTVDGLGNEAYVDGLDLPAASVSNTITFANLAPSTTYRVRAFAYKAAGTAANDKISADAGSYVDVAIGLEDRPALGDLAVTLIDQTFSGLATTPGLTVNDGTIVHSGSAGMTGNVPVAFDDVSTLAGSAVGFDDGVGPLAKFDSPQDVVVNAAGDLFVADQGNHRIRRVTPAGVVTTFAGDGTAASTDGTGAGAQIKAPGAMAIDPAGNLYVCEALTVRKINPAGVVTTLAGDATQPPGYTDATGAAARFTNLAGITVLPNGDLAVSEYATAVVRRVTPAGVVTTIAGGGGTGHVDANGTAARFDGPLGIAADRAGNLYVADSGNHAIRKIEPDRDVTTFVGGTPGHADGPAATARLDTPAGLAVDRAGHLFVTQANVVRRVSPLGVVSTVAGQYGASGATDGTPAAARFTNLSGVYPAPGGTTYVLDYGTHLVRVLADLP